MSYKYTIYKDGKIHAQANTISELSEMTEIPRSTIGLGLKRKKASYGKYTVEKKEDPAKRDYEEIEEPGLQKPYNQWDEVVAPFKNVKWVKYGGRKLKL